MINPTLAWKSLSISAAVVVMTVPFILIPCAKTTDSNPPSALISANFFESANGKTSSSGALVAVRTTVNTFHPCERNASAVGVPSAPFAPNRRSLLLAVLIFRIHIWLTSHAQLMRDERVRVRLLL